ncbi:hypothetical protein BSU04_45825 [Caballeronia sordidicola]|uniref:Uncharacterized protein n=1 Tax=Caballeronia sordidicola TaxID=196367 RepID=A0A226WKC7_CABSO|nr:hypothetical protein BSU04_45825 [Caballeronia sordidicola]
MASHVASGLRRDDTLRRETCRVRREWRQQNKDPQLTTAHQA